MLILNKDGEKVDRMVIPARREGFKGQYVSLELEALRCTLCRLSVSGWYEISPQSWEQSKRLHSSTQLFQVPTTIDRAFEISESLCVRTTSDWYIRTII